MEADSLQARIQHESAELMALYPKISACRTILDEWKDGVDSRYSLRLDIRGPNHQTLISGEAKDTAAAAIAAAFKDARQRLHEAAWALR